MAFGFATSSRSDAVNKDITGNDIPDEVTAVGETPLTANRRVFKRNIVKLN
jgi:hypothetical protein